MNDRGGIRIEQRPIVRLQEHASIIESASSARLTRLGSSEL
jgi:hypothetical protein